jgi:hypothetical protein
MPRVHRVISLLKRWLMGTHQGAVSHKHLDYYLDEFTFRFNRRRSRSRGKLFFRLAQQGVATEPVPLDRILHPRGQAANETTSCRGYLSQADTHLPHSEPHPTSVGSAGWSIPRLQCGHHGPQMFRIEARLDEHAQLAGQPDLDGAGRGRGRRSCPSRGSDSAHPAYHCGAPCRTESQDAVCVTLTENAVAHYKAGIPIRLR